jgi:hypothetical protein
LSIQVRVSIRDLMKEEKNGPVHSILSDCAVLGGDVRGSHQMADHWGQVGMKGPNEVGRLGFLKEDKKS